MGAPSRAALAVLLELVVGVSGSLGSFLEFSAVSQVSLLVRSCCTLMLELDAFRVARDWILFWLGLGLGSSGPFQVAEAGSLGGGMSSCLGGFGGRSASLSAAVCAFEVLRLRVKLNLRRRELPKEVLPTSPELVASMLDASSLDTFLGFCKRGPVNRVGLASAPISKVFDFSSPYPYSPLDLGSEEETKGDMAVRLADRANESEGVGTAVLELLTSR